MANEQNLIPFSQRTESEQREIRRKGGLKRAENARKRKEHELRWQELLSQTDDEGMTMQEKMDMGLWKKACDGDPNAYEKVMEYAGLSKRQALREEELKLKHEELKIRKELAEEQQ